MIFHSRPNHFNIFPTRYTFGYNTEVPYVSRMSRKRNRQCNVGIYKQVQSKRALVGYYEYDPHIS